jgi:hypothetical protein
MPWLHEQVVIHALSVPVIQAPSNLLKPVQHPLRNHNIVLLHERQMSVALDPFLSQICILNLHASLSQVRHRTVIVRRMVTRFSRHDKHRSIYKIYQLPCRLTLHDTRVVIRIFSRNDHRLDFRRVRSSIWLVRDFMKRDTPRTISG